MQELIKAVVQVMTEVEGIDKSLNVGEGKNSYKGVPDQEVKKIVGKAMAKNGLAIFPIKIEPICQKEVFSEVYQGYEKRKMQIFTEVKVTYLLTHTSGESIEIQGYGHGVDSQDKSAGKATTYALKYALLYTFLVATGKIDDTDNEHSEKQPKNENNQGSEKMKIQEKKILKPESFKKALKAIEAGNYSFEELNETYKLTEEQLKECKDLKIVKND